MKGLLKGMRFKYTCFIVFLLSLFYFIGKVEISADTLNSDWIGTLDKSYELAWHQKDDEVHNGYRTYFFLEYTYLLNGSKKYPTYCIEYYKKGPRNNNDYGKTKLKDTDISKDVRNGIIAIIKNGYPNVMYPYGTKDVSEAYYATSAAIHIWTMYHGVDDTAGKYLGWFMYKDGFIMNKTNINQYIADSSTASTASGWHIMGPNNNESSKRTWKAAMELLKCALDDEINSASITINQNKEAYIEGDSIIYEYTIKSNYCRDFKISLSQTISGSKIEYSDEKNNSVIAKLYIPVSSVKSGQSFLLHATGNVYGTDDIENYYYLYHKTGQYQTMIYAEHDKVRSVESAKINVKIPNLEYITYYDLNYSGINYIKYGDFTDISELSYKGDKVVSSKGNVGYVSLNTSGYDYKILNVSFKDTGPDNRLILSTLLNSSTTERFKSVDKELLSFSCYVKTNSATSLKMLFENSSTVYEKKLSNINQWEKITITVTKSDYESNNLCFYCDNVADVQFKLMQLEPGNTSTDFKSENAPYSQPAYSTHKVGDKYGKLYNGVVPTREYLNFVGWNTKKDGSGIYIKSGDVVSEGNQVLYAIWTRQDTYNIYFHYSANSGTALIKNGIYSIYNTGYDVITVPDMTEYDIGVNAYRIDYDFIGWSYENNLDQSAEDKLIDSVYVDGKDVHLYANYRKTHKLRFHYYDDEAESEQIVTYKEMYSYNNHPYVGVVIMPGQNHENGVINIPRIPSYKFCGWSVTPYEKENVDYYPGEYEDAIAYENYYAVYEHSMSVKFYDNVYDSDSTDYHNGSSYLHEDYKLSVGMNCKGEKLKAQLRLPENVCNIDGYEFYGWSDTRTFNGSVCYLAEESGNTIEADTDLRFYALYVKKKVVKFYDYDFIENKQHLERETYVYEYMNYNGDTYNPEMIIQSPCPSDDKWKFSGWVLSDDDSKVYYPEDKYTVKEDTTFYAKYNKNILVNCHSLRSDSEGNIINHIDSYEQIAFMNSAGKVSVDKIVLPDIQAFEDEQKWTGVGYSEESQESMAISHYPNMEYYFYEDTDLFAVYSSCISVNYHDYSLLNKSEVVIKDNYDIHKTCSNKIYGIKIKMPDKLSDDEYECTWWTESLTDSENNKLLPGNELEIYSDKNYYAWHSNIVSLICYDFDKDSVRERIFDGSVLIDSNGNITPSKILIPEQGESDSLVPTGYWSTSEEIVSDYWSKDYINIYTDTILNAIYQKQVNVIYDGNGGKFEDSSIEMTETKYAYYNVQGTKKIPFFTPVYEPYRESFIFEYVWNTDASGNGNIINHKESFFSENNIRLYAMWTSAGEPELSAIDRYFFVGDEIEYEDIVEKIIAKDVSGKQIIDKVEIIKIDNRRSEGLTHSEIASKIQAAYPRQYFIDVRLVSDGIELFDSFVIYIIDKYDEIDRLRYISEEYIDTISSDSKWNYGSNFGRLIITLNKSRDEAEYKVSICKEGDD